MTKTPDSLYPEDWKKTARRDWNRINILLKEDDADGAAFFLQQAIEKYLKAFLLGQGWELRKIHDLSALLDEAVIYKPVMEKFRDMCEKIKNYYFTERYPLIVPSELTAQDIETNKTEAAEFVKALFPGEKEFMESRKEITSEGNS
jgi:HEPN domain-containing protein